MIQRIRFFSEGWDDLSNWALTDASALEVVNNKLYATGTISGGNTQANHGYAISSEENLRFICKVNVPSIGTTGDIIIGVSSASEGSAPTLAAADAFGLALKSKSSNVQLINEGVFDELDDPASMESGEYVVTVTVDSVYISVVATKIGDNTEYACRRLRSEFDVNNLFVFNSDIRSDEGGGSYIDVLGARKSLSSLVPRDSIEDENKTIQWSGDETQSYKVYLPKEYDSRKAYPAIIGFHGAGSDERRWSTNSNYLAMQDDLVSNGFIFLSCGFDSNNNTWGNGDSTNAYYTAYKYLVDNYSISNVGILANSMGGIESLNAIAIEQIPCSAWVGTSPSAGLRAIYDDSTFTSQVNGAYGISTDGSDYDEKTDGRDPLLNDNYLFRGIPMLFIVASGDTIVPPSEHTDKFVAKLGDNLLYSEIIVADSSDHSFDVGPYVSDITDFMLKYVANK